MNSTIKESKIRFMINKFVVNWIEKRNKRAPTGLIERTIDKFVLWYYNKTINDARKALANAIRKDMNKK